MGLDMYLSARKYIAGINYGRKDGEYFSEANTEFDEIIATQGLTRGEVREGSPSLHLEITVAYWRKANAIHGWFVDNAQSGTDNCADYYVGREQLIELRDLCQQVVDNPEDAEELLPTQDGSFFGSTEFDEWYIGSLKDTIEQLDKVLNNSKFDGWDFEYSSSW